MYTHEFARGIVPFEGRGRISLIRTKEFGDDEISESHPIDFSRVIGGRGGIRTPETVARLPVFKTGAFNHSATLPVNDFSEPQPMSDGRPEITRAELFA